MPPYAHVTSPDGSDEIPFGRTEYWYLISSTPYIKDTMGLLSYTIYIRTKVYIIIILKKKPLFKDLYLFFKNNTLVFN
jgi:hypothetical protein